MNITGFLTFVGILIAAYSILNKHDRLKIKIRLSIFNKIATIFFLIIIFFALIISDYFEDYPKEFPFLNLKFKLHFIISASAYTFFLLLSLYIFWKISKKRIKKRKIALFKSLVEEQLNRKEYVAIIELIRPVAVRIIGYSNSVSLLGSIKSKLLKFFKTKTDFEIPPEEYERLKKLIEAGEIELDLEEEEHPKRNIKTFYKKSSISLKHYIGKLLRIFVHEGKDKYQQIAQDLLHLLFTNHEFVAKLIEFRPELGLKIFEHTFYNYHDYVDIYFYELIKNTRSVLYYEIKNNQNINSNHQYFLRKENVLLNFLLRDCKVAQRIEVYRGINNFINDYLDDLNKCESDPYNYDYGNFKETRWISPVFVGIRFFDIMISETMHQGIKWLHPIYYFRVLTEKILKNFDILDDVWSEYNEWNSKYAYLLYEIVSTLDSIVFWTTYSNTKLFINLEREDDNLESGNIPKACIIYQIKILSLIAESEKIPDEFKRYLMNIVLRLLFELRSSAFDEPIRYSNVLFNCIKTHMFKLKKLNVSLYSLIRTSYDEFDKIHYTLGKGKRSDSAIALDREIEEYLTTITEENN